MPVSVRICSQVPGVPETVQIHPVITYLEPAEPSSDGERFGTISPALCVPVVGAADWALWRVVISPSLMPFSCVITERNRSVRRSPSCLGSAGKRGSAGILNVAHPVAFPGHRKEFRNRRLNLAAFGAILQTAKHRLFPK